MILIDVLSDVLFTDNLFTDILIVIILSNKKFVKFNFIIFILYIFHNIYLIDNQ